MKVLIISKSDSEGGAAIVSRRLTEALREQDIRAGMLVLEKKTNLPYVVEAGYPFRKRLAFLRERAQIFFHNGFSRKNLWKVDTAAYGLPLWEHPMVLEADAIILNWVNQGMLSLEGIGRMSPPGKRVIWTMHDMWNLTGICHHAMECRRYKEQCGKCPFLNSGRETDLSRQTWLRKEKLYREAGIRFVAVSNWLADKARDSRLMKDMDISVIPNPFLPVEVQATRRGKTRRILFAAATLDNWIKGLSTFRESIRIFREKYPALASKAEVVLMGGVKNPENIEGFALPVDFKGVIRGEKEIAEIYGESDVIVNSSVFENLPSTLIEGQAYGAVPVAFDRGGQRDIVENGVTGFLAAWDDDETVRAGRLADGIAAAFKALDKDAEALRMRMRHNVEERFSYRSVAKEYIKALEL